MPVSGGNKTVGDAVYPLQNFFFNRSEIQQKGKELLKTKPLSQILNLATNDVLYGDIRSVTLKQRNITIEKVSGEKLGYAFMDPEYDEEVKRLFRF